eukprot:3941486-Rhodomonas_salina.3
MHHERARRTLQREIILVQVYSASVPERRPRRNQRQKIAFLAQAVGALWFLCLISQFGVGDSAYLVALPLVAYGARAGSSRCEQHTQRQYGEARSTIGDVSIAHRVAPSGTCVEVERVRLIALLAPNARSVPDSA